MMLRARFVRWFHLMKHLMTRDYLPHRAVDIYTPTKYLCVACTCGKEWR